MKKSFVLLIFFLSLLFVSCKDKTSEFWFTWNGNFSKEFLQMIVDHPEELEAYMGSSNEKQEKSSPVVNDEPLEDFVFYGVNMKQMGEILKQFGDCKMNFKVCFTVETNGLKITKMYINKDSELFCDFTSENMLPEIIHKTADIMIKDYPVHKLSFTPDDKSFSYYCKYPKPFVIFDSSVSGNEIDLSKMETPKKKKGLKFQLKNGSAVVTAEDNELDVFMQFIISKK
ncbi:MAG: hypothetical protein HUK25_05300 [Treponema sp.]|nr:hypothetical protein [Treponema sp.]